VDLIEGLHTILYATEYQREVWMSFALNLWQNCKTDTINSSIYSFRQNAQKAVATNTAFIAARIFMSRSSPHHGATASSGPGPHYYRGVAVTLWHATLSRSSLYQWSTPRRDLYLTPHNTHEGQISMPFAGFEHAIPASRKPAP
jgi:hypothetical protein